MSVRKNRERKRKRKRDEEKEIERERYREREGGRNKKRPIEREKQGGMQRTIRRRSSAPHLKRQFKGAQMQLAVAKYLASSAHVCSAMSTC